MVSIEEYEAIGTMDACDELFERRDMISIIYVLEELRDYLSISLRVESASLLDEFGLQFAVVLDDTIMDDDESP